MTKKCPSCNSTGFEDSKLGPHRCEFCDGTFGGNPPTNKEIEESMFLRTAGFRSCEIATKAESKVIISEIVRGKK